MPPKSAPRINWAAIATVMLITATLVTTGWTQRAAVPATQGPAEPTRPNWLRRGISDIAWRPMAAAERAVFLTRWAEYDRLFATPDSLARPQGFTVAPSALAYSEGAPSTLFHFYYRYIFLQGVVTGGEGSALLSINENPVARNIWTVDSGPATFKDAQGEMYTERPRHGSLPGLPSGAIVFDGPLQFDSRNPSVENTLRVLLTANGELPWSDVPRERVLKLLIAEAQKLLDEMERLYADSNYRKAIESIDAGKPARDIAYLRGQLARVTGDLAKLSSAELPIHRIPYEVAGDADQIPTDER